MPSAANAALCSVGESECATGWPIKHAQRWLKTHDSRLTTHDSLEIGPEAGVGDRDAVGAGNFGAVAECAGQSEQHRHAMVVVTIDPARLQTRRPDTPTIGSSDNVASQL